MQAATVNTSSSTAQPPPSQFLHRKGEIRFNAFFEVIFVQVKDGGIGMEEGDKTDGLCNEVLGRLEDEEIDVLIRKSQDHPWLKEYEKWARHEYQLEDEWYYAIEEGDPLEDFCALDAPTSAKVEGDRTDCACAASPVSLSANECAVCA